MLIHVAMVMGPWQNKQICICCFISAGMLESNVGYKFIVNKLLVIKMELEQDILKHDWSHALWVNQDVLSNGFLPNKLYFVD